MAIAIMTALIPNDTDDEPVEIVALALPLDRKTLSWLTKMSKNDIEAAQVVADMLRAIREDDEQAERILH
jgi:hypothetical protein